MFFPSFFYTILVQFFFQSSLCGWLLRPYLDRASRPRE